MALLGFFIKLTVSAMRGVMGMSFKVANSNAILAFAFFSALLLIFAAVQYVFVCVLSAMRVDRSGEEDEAMKVGLLDAAMEAANQTRTARNGNNLAQLVVHPFGSHRRGRVDDDLNDEKDDAPIAELKFKHSTACLLDDVGGLGLIMHFFSSCFILSYFRLVPLIMTSSAKT